MTPLTAGNTRVKEARKLHRRPERSGRRCFLADGPKAVEGALGAGVVVEVFATTDAARQYADLLAEAPVTLVDDRAMGGLSDSVSPAGLVAVCRFLEATWDSVVEVRALRGSQARTSGQAEQGVETPRLLTICADVRDPGNAGTVIRTSDAAGAGAVVLAGDSVDPYNPKTVRATVGSLFRLPVLLERDPAAAVRRAQAAGLTVLAADGGGEVDLFEADELLERPTAWLFGNEAWGLPDELAALADHRVSIPILGGAESLNLATAAAVCLYASARAHRTR
ncbi:TrmH family RNA methyltransferase [Pimelobacter simplex]|uniref:TrmH family RNA methyltransferase n=1 Tax=Nocardioides simplex TaxID=2045 RepID=UPI001932DA4F|nr:RNA methyltransferase [Pimelobacter simplex]